MMRRRHLLATPALLAAPALLASPLGAQSWPAGPVRIVSPFTPGGASDLSARFVAQALTQATGGTFLVENRTGAGGNLGMDHVARGPADGSVFVVAAAAAAINHTYYRSMPFDLLRDLAPVTVVMMVPNVLSVHPSSPVRDARGFVEWARGQASGITYGSAGIGTMPHLAMEMFCRRAGITATHVPFRGSAPAVTELVAGRLQAVFENLPPQSGQLRAGSVRGLGISSTEPHPDFADIRPIGAALGWEGFAPVAWQSLMAPAATPAPIIARVAEIVAAAMRQEEHAARLRAAGALPSGMPPAEFRDFLAREVATWGEAVRAVGIRADG